MQFTHYPAGTVLRVRFSTYWHYGIADGQGCVIHNSKKWREVRREPETEFAEGRAIEVSKIMGDDPDQAVALATSQIGRPYDLLQHNCEQFVREAHGLPAECTQIQRLLAAAAGGYLTLKAESHLERLAGIGMLVGAVSASSEMTPYPKAAAGARLAVGSGLILTTLYRTLLKKR
ncbi:lecithin retinol acyltransferase family protein [Photobacterium sp. GSS17]|uniref:lecithin retinol acyltransferase family protein n=1 Tax=Photobacterium sp. GSS17 TaxID=3020715 RepID=UPI0023600170|nr:lecithin retinol acyltransferase family protein [Photobacterium sp. GSS17]